MDKGHKIPIQFMSDYDSVLKRREKPRYPELTDQENTEIYRVYFGNPFRWSLNK